MPGDTGEPRDQVEHLLSLVVDPIWYRARHRDVAASGVDPLRHFIDSGLRERRDPNRWFDGAWYVRQYPDVAAAGTHPLLHYMSEGAKLGRDPHPRFDAEWYSRQHPEAAGNPLLFHIRIGSARGFLTERPVAIEDYLPSSLPALEAPDAVTVDIVIPVYRGLAATRLCLRSVLADADRPNGRIIVIDDRSPEPKLSGYLDRLAATGSIILLRNPKNTGFVAAANLGLRHAGKHDVVLLNSDTEVPSGWLRRLRAQAYAAPNIASVSPLSNNATICSYLGYEGGPMPPDVTLAAIDAACATANRGRSADAPTTVGFCMYIRRAALDAIGLFDAATFGKGYGEENDFCLRAIAAGWRHRITCDTFVRHQGGVSFGASADAAITRAFAILTERYPDYPLRIAQFVEDGATEAARFAATMALFRSSGLPTTLVISHELDGGVRRHVMDQVARDAGRINYLLLEPASRGVSLSVPALPGLPKLVLAAERWRDVAAVARSAGVARVHIHHLMGLDLDARALLHGLAVPFDVTVHDYYPVCPQVTLLPWPTGPYCGEPGPDGCDACIANRPSHGATDILSWRQRWAWQFHEADRVLVPSRDALERLRRHGLGSRAMLTPHEPAAAERWPVHLPPRPGKRLTVAVLGVLADHKGAQLVASVAMAAGAGSLDIMVIGDVEANIPDAARQLMTVHGRYQEGEAPGLLAKYRPHVVWFPAPWPETYSYTLSAAIDAGLPIVASDIGAFPERLTGRPFTWLHEPTLDPAGWLSVFQTVADALRAPRRKSDVVRRGPIMKGKAFSAALPATRPASRVKSMDGLVDRRRAGATAVVVIPETFDDGSYTPCAHIRLLRPLDHPASGLGLIPIITPNAAAASRYQADVIVTQRHAVPTIAAAEALAAHAERSGATLIYDLDDDLLTIPPDHPEAAELTSMAAVVAHLIRRADIVRVSTAALANRVAPLARRVEVVGNALDERIWVRPRRPSDPYGPVRILCMGTHTHDADFAVVLQALTELRRLFGNQIQFDLIGFVAGTAVPEWIRRVPPSTHAARSYPGFVNWITGMNGWDLGLAPLADTPFNASKSPIKVLDYAALGLAILASDVPAYRGSLADGPGGLLVSNATDAWFAALSRMVRDVVSRRALASGAIAAFRGAGTLSSQAERWRRLSWHAASSSGPARATKRRRLRRT